MKNKKTFFFIVAITVMLVGLIVSSCESSRVGPELPQPNPPAPVAQPIILSAFVRDISDLSPIAGATVKITKADNTLIATLLTDNSGKYSYDVTNLTENTVLVNANKDGYGFSTKVAEIQKALNNASVDVILLAKLQVVSTVINSQTGGQATTPNTQTVSTTPLTVTVPPNAVPANITLTIAPMTASQVPEPPTTTNSIQSAAQFGPTGTVFAVPVTVIFPLPNKQAVGKTFNLLKLNETTKVWASTGIIATVDASGTAATAQLSSFSTYGCEDPLTINISAGTTTTVNIETITLASDTTSRRYSETNSVSSSFTGVVSTSWLLGLITSETNVGTFTQSLFFGVPQIPVDYLRNGVQYNPADPNQSGNWSYQWVVIKNTTTRNWTATGGVAPNNFSGSGSIIEEKVEIGSSEWVWIAHNQGGIL